MRLEKCFFCSSTVYPGHGITFVRNDCKIFKFCRSKCHKAFKRKRNPRRTRWTKAHRKVTGKELTMDPSQEFEKLRNLPQKYSREQWKAAVETMKTAELIKSKRENLHLKNRLRKGKQLTKKRDMQNLEKNISLIKSPAALLKKGETISIEEEESDKEELMEAN